MPNCVDDEAVCHRVAALAAAMLVVVVVGALSLTLYRPSVDEFVALHWALFGGVVLQALALQAHRCFDPHRAWAGAASTAYIGVLAAVAATLWVRYHFACAAECHVAHLAVAESTALRRSNSVQTSASFATLVAGMAALVCGGRWVSVAVVRRARRKAERVSKRRSARRARADDDDDVLEMDTLTDDDEPPQS